MKINHVFGPEWRVYIKTDGQKVAWNEKEIVNLNNSGFGQIFDKVYFYKKGYTQFLKDWINGYIRI